MPIFHTFIGIQFSIWDEPHPPHHASKVQRFGFYDIEANSFEELKEKALKAIVKANTDDIFKSAPEIMALMKAQPDIAPEIMIDTILLERSFTYEKDNPENGTKAGDIFWQAKRPKIIAWHVTPQAWFS